MQIKCSDQAEIDLARKIVDNITASLKNPHMIKVVLKEEEVPSEYKHIENTVFIIYKFVSPLSKMM